eukprot:1797675-Rhodomonas_salina.1
MAVLIEPILEVIAECRRVARTPATTSPGTTSAISSTALSVRYAGSRDATPRYDPRHTSKVALHSPSRHVIAMSDPVETALKGTALSPSPSAP